MNHISTDVRQHDAISKTLQHYIDGTRAGKGGGMKPAFHENATIHGYAGGDLFAGPIQLLFDWSDENGAAAELEARIASIDLAGTIAIVRLELTNLNGADYTDMFTLLKVDGDWKIMSKVFHRHS